MANNTEPTTKFKADISELKAAMQQATRDVRLANAEFKAASSGMDDWANSADGISAKLKQLNTVLDAEKRKLAALEDQHRLVVQEQGENSRGAQELAIKIANQQAVVNRTAREIRTYSDRLDELENSSDDTSDALKDMDTAAKQAGKSVESAGDSAKNSGDGFTVLKGAMANLVSQGINSIISGIGNLATSFFNLAESTRETRTNMAKLETGFTTAGLSAEDASATYQEFYGILGDEGQATEASAHLAQLANNQEDLQKWTTIATGVYATFGDSLPIEGLTEAANETAKTGALTGGLADALNWAGVNEEDFQSKLDACSSEQERQALITNTLNGLYSDASNAYKELNGDVIEAQKASARYSQALADIGASAEPLNTAFRSMAAGLLEEMAPAIDEVAKGFSGMLNMEEGASKQFEKGIQELSATVTDSLGKVLTMIIHTGSLMLPKIIEAILGMLPELATTIVTVVNTLANKMLEMAPTFIKTIATIISDVAKSITDRLPLLVSAVVEVVPQIINSLMRAIPQLLNAAIKLLMAIVEAIPTIITNLLSELPKIITTIIDTLLNAIPRLLDAAEDLLMAIVEAIPSIILQLTSTLPSIITTIINAVVSAVPQLLSAAITLFMAIIEAIPTIINALIINLPHIINTIITAVIDALPLLLNAAIKLLMAIVDAIPTIVTSLTSRLPAIITTILNAVLNAVPQLLDAAITLLSALLEAIPTIVERLIEELPLIIQTIVDVVVGAVPQLLDAAIELLMAVVDAIPDIVNALINNLPKIINTIIDAVVGALPQLLDAAFDLFMAIVQAIPQFLPELISKLPEIASTILEALGQIPGQILDIGKDIVMGLWEGIKSMGSWLWDKLTGWVDDCLGWIKGLFGINSPSKLFRDEIGKFLPEGLAVGMEGNLNVVRHAASEMVDAATPEIPAFDVSSNIGSSGKNSASIVFNQYNTSPKALSRLEIYRQTRNQLRMLRGVV